MAGQRSCTTKDARETELLGRPDGEMRAEVERRVDDDSLTIQQASVLLQVPPPTLRSWERRYRIVEVSRSAGGHRRYTLEQIRVLRSMRDGIARGQLAAEAAETVKSAALASPTPLIQAFLRAARQLDPGQVTAALDTARTQLGLDRTIDEVLFPAMQQVGRDWRVGRCDVAHEHLATQCTRSWLSSVKPEREPRQHGAVLLACGPRDPHTLGLEAIAALLRFRGCDCRLLGASLPAPSLRRACIQLNPSVLVLVSHRPVARTAAAEALQGVRDLPVHLFYAGNAFRTQQSRRGVPGTHLGDNVGRAADVVAAATSQQRSVGH